MNKLFLFILGELLHLANSRPPYMWKYDFYRVKDEILNRYAVYVGMDLQHIRKDCYACDGEKYEKVTVLNFGVLTEMGSRPCWKCGGTGVYEQFWVNLKRYKLGRQEFHSPTKKFYNPEGANIEYLEYIEGYISHTAPKFYLAAESTFWLVLFFKPSLFFRHFGKTGYPSWKFTPMVIISTVIFNVSRIPGNIARRWRMIKGFFLSVKQRYCTHEFGLDGQEWECSKCQATNPEYDIPF